MCHSRCCWERVLGLVEGGIMKKEVGSGCFKAVNSMSYCKFLSCYTVSIAYVSKSPVEKQLQKAVFPKPGSFGTGKQ